MTRTSSVIARPGVTSKPPFATVAAAVVLLAPLAALGPLASDMYVASLPAIGAALDSDPRDVQLTLTVFLYAFAFGQLFAGPVSDRVGRRPVLLVGLSVFVLASLWAALASSLEMLVMARLAQALAISVAPLLARAVVRDGFDRARSTQALGYLGGVMAVAPAVGPAAGGLLQDLGGWRLSFFVLAGLGILVMALLSLSLPETRPTSQRPTQSPFRTYGRLLRHPGYVSAVAALGLIYGGYYAFAAVGPFVLADRFGLGSQAIGVGFLVIIASYIVGSVLTAQLINRVSETTLIRLGIGVAFAAALAMVGLALADLGRALPVILLMGTYMGGYGILVPTLTVKALQPFRATAGAAAALLGCAEMALAATVALAAGVVAATSLLGLAVVVAAAPAIALAFLILPSRPASASSDRPPRSDTEPT